MRTIFSVENRNLVCKWGGAAALSLITYYTLYMHISTNDLAYEHTEYTENILLLLPFGQITKVHTFEIPSFK